MSDCMVVRSSRIGSVKDNLSRRMEGRKTREIGEFIRIYSFVKFKFTVNCCSSSQGCTAWKYIIQLPCARTVLYRTCFVVKCCLSNSRVI